jgi:cytidylate kinase
MAEKNPFVITISRQMGTGASYIGQHVAAKLGIGYLDQEILQQAAKQLKVSEETVEDHDETMTPFWAALLQSFAWGSVDEIYAYPPKKQLSDQEVYQAESQIIIRLAQEESAVIVGRGGIYMLRDHPRHLSLFLYAEKKFRVHRIMEIQDIPEPDAEGIISASDQNRTRFHHAIAGKEWNDARQYHLCLDTGRVGLEESIKLILALAKDRFGIA